MKHTPDGPSRRDADTLRDERGARPWAVAPVPPKGKRLLVTNRDAAFGVWYGPSLARCSETPAAQIDCAEPSSELSAGNGQELGRSKRVPAKVE